MIGCFVLKACADGKLYQFSKRSHGNMQYSYYCSVLVSKVTSGNLLPSDDLRLLLITRSKLLKNIWCQGYFMLTKRYILNFL